VDSSMDGVISLHTIYHMRRDKQEAAFHEVFRVLAPGRRAAVVYSWGKTSTLNKLLMGPRLLKRFAGRILRKAGLASDPHLRTRSRMHGTPTLFAEPQSYKWFVTRPWPFDFEIGVWRTLNVEVLRLYVHERLFGRQVLAALFAFEERFPRLCAAIGQYGVISIHKQAKLERAL
jgi:hypothetical protein